MLFAEDFLYPLPATENRKHMLKRLVPISNSYFIYVKCPRCFKIITVFSHVQSVEVWLGCSTILCQTTGGKAQLMEGYVFRKKSC